MSNAESHAAVVSAWLADNAEGMPPRRIIGNFKRAWDALWRRAETALGDITTKAAAERALAGAAEKYPVLAPLRAEAWDRVLADLQDGGRDAEGLPEALGFLLSESLSLLGHLSGGILTPALHDALVRRDAPGSGAPAPPGTAARKSPSPGGTIQKIGTGVRNLDAVLGGGLPEGSISVIAGAPGSGKTTLGQQIGFHLASSASRVLYMSTFSEPSAKLMQYMRQFDYFDSEKLSDFIRLIDIGKTLRKHSIDHHREAILASVEKLRPSLLVIDSFKCFESMARSSREFQRFTFDLAASLVAWDCTTLLIGEYVTGELAANPLFSVVDGLVMLSHRDAVGEEERFLQVLKMRGAAHCPDLHPFEITARGIEVFAPRVTIRRAPRPGAKRERMKIGISKFDDLLDGGIPRGSSVLVSGVSGTGKTVLLLETLYRGALAGEKGMLFSFEEAPDRLRETARGLGWDFDAQLERGLIEIVFIPQPDIRIESHLRMMHERIAAARPSRVAIDSLSVFLHKAAVPSIAREKTFQLAAVVEEVGAVGFFATDVPYGTGNISRMGVEETVTDGTIILSAAQDGLERRRYVEIYKLRATPHLLGRHTMVIGTGGVRVFPRYNSESRFLTPPPAFEAARRVGSGVPGLDELLGGGLYERSATIVSGCSGSGKSTIALQFIQEGARRGEKGVYVTLEEGPGQILANAEALEIPLREMSDKGLVEILYFPPERIRAAQFLTDLTDKIQEGGVRRLVVDSTSHLVTAGIGHEEAQQLLYNLVVRFKTLGVTSVLTLESERTQAAEDVAEGGISPVADNLILLRCASNDAHTPLLRVIKTRGSAHAAETHSFGIGKGGASVGLAARGPAGRELALP